MVISNYKKLLLNMIAFNCLFIIKQSFFQSDPLLLGYTFYHNRSNEHRSVYY